MKSYHQSGAAANTSTAAPTAAPPAASVAKLEVITGELEEQRELATNRLAELDRLHREHRDTLKEVEKLKMEVSLQYLFIYFFTLLHKYSPFSPR